MIIGHKRWSSGHTLGSCHVVTVVGTPYKDWLDRHTIRVRPIAISYLLYQFFLIFFFKFVPSVADGWIGHYESLLQRKECGRVLKDLFNKPKVPDRN